MNEQSGMQRSNSETSDDTEGLRFAEIASAKARGESVSVDDEALFQASLRSPENVAESGFWSGLVEFAKADGPRSALGTNNQAIEDQVYVERILSKYEHLSRIQRQRKWMLSGSALMMSAAALWAFVVLEPNTSIWVARHIDAQGDVEHAVMSSQASSQHHKARPRASTRKGPHSTSNVQDSLDSDQSIDEPSPLVAEEWNEIGEESQSSDQIDEAKDPGSETTDAPSSTSVALIQRAKNKRFESAERMLMNAQKQLANGNRRAAWFGYRKLIRRYPKSFEAKVSLVSLGRIGLQLGYAKQALRYFERYLRQGTGNLREEARFGRIEALAKLGDRPGEMEAIRDFMERIPNSVYRHKLEQRLKRLRADNK